MRRGRKKVSDQKPFFEKNFALELIELVGLGEIDRAIAMKNFWLEKKGVNLKPGTLVPETLVVGNIMDMPVKKIRENFLADSKTWSFVEEFVL